ncbi:hypothetical protein DLAC_02830 [Tieghemostelium lacteum]|uniref:Transmembrane protein n=1 Tax=Tieghemostelium lacteum TaxID=361077 RepID=A0A152A3E7_TIELA|nr:hypothetical protein DLAC_02830 [Tieghemostelium lacteum]|eukprot:KYR00783.1 hypothetical protein DLAC_02830 [Tieghemostelium lacteum]
MGEIISNCCKFLCTLVLFLMALFAAFAFYSAPYFAMFTPIQVCKGDVYYLRTVQLENGKYSELPNDYVGHHFKNIFIMLAIAAAIQSASLMISCFEICCCYLSPHRVNFLLCMSLLLWFSALIYLEVIIHRASIFNHCSTGFNSIAILILLVICTPFMIYNNLKYSNDEFMSRVRAQVNDYQPIV